MNSKFLIQLSEILTVELKEMCCLQLWLKILSCSCLNSKYLFGLAFWGKKSPLRFQIAIGGFGQIRIGGLANSNYGQKSILDMLLRELKQGC